jgi:glucans biosynthesis protein
VAGARQLQVQFVHPGLYYNYAVGINVVEGNEVRKVDFSPSLFTYGRNKIVDKIPADLGFAGFRIASLCIERVNCRRR